LAGQRRWPTDQFESHRRRRPFSRPYSLSHNLSTDSVTDQLSPQKACQNGNLLRYRSR
jgi:hypothetical protein